MSLVDLTSCSVLAHAGQSFRKTSFCDIEKSHDIFVTTKTGPQKTDLWALQVFPHKVSNVPTHRVLVSGLKLSLNWLAPLRKDAIETYGAKLIAKDATSSPSELLDLSDIDSQLGQFQVVVDDFWSRYGAFIPFANADDVSRAQNIVALFFILLSCAVLVREKKREQRIKMAAQEFNQFLSKELGLQTHNSTEGKKNAGDIIRGWQQLLQNIDIQAKEVQFEQKRQIAKLNSEKKSAQVTLKRLESENFELRRMRFVSQKIKSVGQKFKRLEQEILPDKSFFNSKDQEQVKLGLNHFRDIFTKWATGIEDRGLRRYFRYLYEIPSSDKNICQLEEDIEILNQAFEIIDSRHLTTSKSSQKVLKEFQNFKKSFNLIVQSSKDQSVQSAISFPKLVEQLKELELQDHEHNIEISFSKLPEQEIAINNQRALVLAHAVYHIILYFSLRTHKQPSSDHVDCKFKYKESGNGCYLVLMVASQKTNDELKDSRETEKQVNAAEDLLGSIKSHLQIIENSPMQLVLSISWEKDHLTSTPLERLSSTRPGEYELPLG